MRVLIGSEPVLKSPRRRTVRHSQEIIDYWLERGISITQSAGALRAIQFLEDSAAAIRISGAQPVHAKVYVTHQAATIGSSNFTEGGMIRNAEANVRFEREGEPARYREAWEVAEGLWATGEDFKAGLLDLLRRLVQLVSWRHALGRACAELLEGAWLERRLGLGDRLGLTLLWPSQRQGVAQALWAIENLGGVLIADATGSGKTRTGARLIRELEHQLIRTGRDRGGVSVLLAPPAIQDKWSAECLGVGTSPRILSHGLLSRADSKKGVEVREAIRRAQVLAVDEAHQFHNTLSVRTRTVYRNAADHVILFTATPINRGPRDLLAIVDLLGADNFDDATLRVVEEIARRTVDEETTEDEWAALREAIQRFTVRRTRPMLVDLIDADPTAYQDRLGRPCRYPQRQNVNYPLNESDRDVKAAHDIRELAGKLKGILYLRSPFRLTPLQRRMGITEEEYLRRRLAGARGLARYHVMAALRSSRLALLEHLSGTATVRERYRDLGITKNNPSGGIIQKLRGVRGSPPQSQLSVELPSFLVDTDRHRSVVDDELQILNEIVARVDDLTDARERGKARLLIHLAEQGQRVLAFPSLPI